MAYHIHKKSFGLKHFGIIFSAVALVFLTIGIVCFLNARAFLKSSVITEGEVVDIMTSRSKDYDGNYSTVKYPVVRFTESEGKTVEFQTSVSSNHAIIYGEKVKVRYIPSDPKNAELDTWIDIWFPTLIVSIFFVIFGFLGIGMCLQKE